MLYLHEKSLSPDPLYGQGKPESDTLVQKRMIYPHLLIRATNEFLNQHSWSSGLHLHRQSPQIQFRCNGSAPAEIVLDFGTELEGSLLISLTTASTGTVLISFGESPEEAEGWAMQSICEAFKSKTSIYLDTIGKVERSLEPRGFRFVKLQFFDFTGTNSVDQVSVDAQFTYSHQRGDFFCSDKVIQRVWQSSVYTARLCTRPDTIWDGVKRDRHGWYGDARITKEAADIAFYQPEPAEIMMTQLPTNGWANGIPNYSFDCIAMLKQHILFYGINRQCVQDVYSRIRALFDWMFSTQIDKQGLFVRNNKVTYFFDIGFLDWSLLPPGGRFEELSWLQFAYLEALRDTAQIATWLDKNEDAILFTTRADELTPKLIKRFYDKSTGFHHTLNMSKDGIWEKALDPNVHFKQSYIDKIKFGKSGPSRQSAARAVFAGLVDEEMRPVVRSTFTSTKIAPIVTTYYHYYEKIAQAECGDSEGALISMRDFMGQMLTENDAATIWEVYEPEIKGYQRLGLNAWPKSLCHGWGSGTVSLVVKYLAGLYPQSPGYGSVAIRPAAALPCTFDLTLPTPFGDIRAVRGQVGAPVEYTIPDGIEQCKI